MASEIVVLDGYTLNPGDISWSGFEALGQTTVYDRTSREETIKRASGFEYVLTNKTVPNYRMLNILES